MTDSTHDVNLRNPNSATIDLATFYNSVRLDAVKRIGLFDAGLIAYVETTADYDLNPANRDNHNVLALRAGNVRPQLAAGANAAAVTIYNIHVLDYQSLAASLLIISDKIFHGISPATQTVMNEHASSHPDFFRNHGRRWIFYFFAMAQSALITSRNPNACSAHRLTPSLTLWSRTVSI